MAPDLTREASPDFKAKGSYPGPNHRMPVCCKVMKDAMAPDYGDKVLQEPPSGQGASLTIRYVLPRRDPQL